MQGAKTNERTNDAGSTTSTTRALSSATRQSLDREGEANDTDSSSTHFAGAGVTHEHDFQPFLGRVLLDVRHEGRGRWESCKREHGPTTTSDDQEGPQPTIARHITRRLACSRTPRSESTDVGQCGVVVYYSRT